MSTTAATIHLPTPLRPLADGATEVCVSAGTVKDALDALARAHPRLRRHLFTDDGALRGYVNVFLNEDEVRTLPRQDATLLGEGDTIMIIPSIAGGSPPALHEGLERDEITRYARHITLPEVGWEGQKRLKAARVAVIGAGGLGSPAALYLAAAGVGTLGLIDDDVVDLTNLQRQILYGTDDLGAPKVARAARRLHETNPHVHIERHPARLTSANALGILENYDVILDGTDNFPTRYLANDAAVLLKKPYVYGSIYRFEGQASVFDGRTGPCYRCLFREPPPPGLVPNCAEGGVLGVLPGIIGSVQALEVIKLILGIGETLAGRLALFDALRFRWRELKLQRNPECPVCGDQPTITELIDYDLFCGLKEEEMAETTEPNGHRELAPRELKARLDAGERPTLIDVREAHELDISSLEAVGARHIPMGDLQGRLGELDQEEELVLICRTGSRSGALARYLHASGFPRVANLTGGINEWSRTVDPSLPTY
ncbi:MAG: molybdopterin-synthase adenylyltransferase MoeB [Gemmatimonadota bacterium]